MRRPAGASAGGAGHIAAPTAAGELGLLPGDDTALPFLPAASPDSRASHGLAMALKALTDRREHRSTGTAL